MSDLDDSRMAAASEAESGAEAGMPRWVKVFVVIAAVVVLFVVATQFIGEGHRPGRHGGGDPPAADDGKHESPIDHTP